MDRYIGVLYEWCILSVGFC